MALNDQARARAEAALNKQRRKRANADKANGDPSTTILLKAGDLPGLVAQVDAILATAPEPRIFQRGRALVQPVLVKVKTADGTETEYQQLEVLDRGALAAVLNNATHFKKYNERREQWVPADCPDSLAAAYLAHASWKAPAIVGITSTPTLRADGTLLDAPGFDRQTGLLYDPMGAAFPKIGEKLTHDDAAFALDALSGAVSTFPFVADVDLAVALSAIMTVVLRCAFGQAPMHGFTAPAAGTGKSLLADVCTAIALGARCSVMTTGGSKEEMEKRIDSVLLAAQPVVSFDNCEHPLGGAKLCAAITQAYVEVRILGLTKSTRIPTATVFFATGNNLRLKGDATRRALMCCLDAKCENPELREFERDAYAYAFDQRAQLVAACLTIARAFILAGAPPQRGPIGSFEGWRRFVRDPLIWAGAADPTDCIADIKADDPERDQAGALIESLEGALACDTRWNFEDGLTAADIVKCASGLGSAAVDALREAVAAVAADRKGAISAVRLGHYLKHLRGRIIDRRSIEVVRQVNRANFWTVISHAKLL